MQWKKIGLIYDAYNKAYQTDWRYHYAQGQNVLIYDSFIRVYCCCREKPNQEGKTVSHITYVDLDRKDLTKIIKVSDKPILPLGGLGEFDEFGTYPFTVIRNEKQIYGYYGGVTRCESVPFNVAIGCAVSSDDGETFERLGSGPVLSYSLFEPFVVCSPKVRKYDGVWYMFYSSGREWLPVADHRPEIYYKLRMATSSDGIHWVKQNCDIIEDKLGPTEAQACGDVIYKNGKYHMFFCYRNCFDFRTNKNNTYRIGYAVSNDLYHWCRKDELVGIDISNNPNDFDSQMVAYPNVFELDGQIYMLYLGNEVGKYGFGLAVLEGDLV